MKKSSALLLLVTAPVSLWAHHSVAEYDRSVLHEVEGTLVDVRWRNPHVQFSVQADEPDGAPQTWEFEAAAPYVLERAGLSRSMLSTGSTVRVAGWVSTQRPRAMNASNLLVPSGQEMLFYPISRPRWSEHSAGGRWLSESVDRAQRGLFRIWSVADLEAYQQAARSVEFRLTPAAEAMMRDFPDFDPCVPQGMPGVMLSPLPFEVIEREDHIDLQLTSFGVLRRIVLTGDASAADVPLSDLGYSVGQLDGGTLEVRTTRIDWPYLDDAGSPQTPQVEILERFSLVDDGNRLRYSQTVHEPVMLTEPMTVSWDLIDIGEIRIEPLTCD